MFFLFFSGLTRARQIDSRFTILLRHQRSLPADSIPLISEGNRHDPHHLHMTMRRLSVISSVCSPPPSSGAVRGADTLGGGKKEKNAHIDYTHYSAPQPSSQQYTARLRFITREVTHRLPLPSPLPPSPPLLPPTTLITRHTIPNEMKPQCISRIPSSHGHLLLHCAKTNNPLNE